MRAFLDAVALLEQVTIPDAVVQAATDRVMGEVENYSLDGFYNQMSDGDQSLRDWLVDCVYDAEGTIVGHFHGDEIALFREVIAPADWDYRSDTRPHLYWAYDAQAAHAHWGEEDREGVRWLLTAKANQGEIDWVKTLARGANMALQSECEIILKKGVVPTILSAEPRDANFSNRYF